MAAGSTGSPEIEGCLRWRIRDAGLQDFLQFIAESDGVTLRQEVVELAEELHLERLQCAVMTEALDRARGRGLETRKERALSRNNRQGSKT
jgi:hypothetical protein